MFYFFYSGTKSAVSQLYVYYSTRFESFDASNRLSVLADNRIAPPQDGFRI